MQHSAVLPSTLTTLLGLEPAGGNAGPRALEERDTGGGFAALLAALHGPAGGEALPSGGKVLPLGAAAPTRDGAAQGGTLPLPSDATMLAHRGAGPTRVGVTPPPASGGIDALLDLPGRASEAPNPATTAAARLVDAAIGAAGSASPGAATFGTTATSTPTVEAAPVAAATAATAMPSAEARPSATMSTISTISTRSAISAEPVEAPPIEHSAFDERRAEPDLRAAVDAGRRDAEPAPAARASEGDARGSADDPVARIAARAGAATPAADPPAPPSVLAAAPAAAGAPPPDLDPGAIRPQPAPHDAGATRAAPGELGDAVAGRIRLMVDQGAGEARLRLDPPELGTIDVRISVVDDKTFVQLTASHAAGRDALEQSLPRLRELLAAGGLDVGGTSVDGGGRSASSGYASGGAADAYALAEGAGDAVDAPASRGDRPARSTSRVDLYA